MGRQSASQSSIVFAFIGIFVVFGVLGTSIAQALAPFGIAIVSIVVVVWTAAAMNKQRTTKKDRET